MSKLESIQYKIYTIRGQQVMLDRDLALLYGVEVKYLNRQVKRNHQRFPDNFCFQLSDEEFHFLRCQNVTSNTRGGRRYNPYVFTEYGVAMLSAVLKSDVAVEVSVQIMNAFVQMRHFLQENKGLFQRVEAVEKRQLLFEDKIQRNFSIIFKKLATEIPPQCVFFNGQMHEAALLITKLISQARKRIILVDNYINAITIDYFREVAVPVSLYTKSVPHLAFMPEHIVIRAFDKSHDRFLLIDDDVYHIGASLKDLGKSGLQLLGYSVR